MEVDLAVSSRVLKRGDVLTVNCTVKRSDVVFFTWEFPRRQVSCPLTDRLSACLSVGTVVYEPACLFPSRKLSL